MSRDYMGKSEIDSERRDALADASLDDEGIDFALVQLCKYLGVDPDDVTWDAATETVDGDVQAVIGNIFCTKFGEDWSPSDPHSSERTEGDRKLLQWLGKGRGVGLSSKAIALTALGEMPDRPDYPHDPDDFSRCRALLENIPFAKRGLEKLGTDGGPIWAALAERWDEIDAQFEESERAGWKDDGKCYRLMQSIIYPVLGWRVPVSGSTEGGNG